MEYKLKFQKITSLICLTFCLTGVVNAHKPPPMPTNRPLSLQIPTTRYENSAATFLQIGAFKHYSNAARLAKFVHNRLHLTQRILKQQKKHSLLYLVQVGPIKGPAGVVEYKFRLQQAGIVYEVMIYDSKHISRYLPKPKLYEKHKAAKEEVLLRPPSFEELDRVFSHHIHVEASPDPKVKLETKKAKFLSLYEAILLTLRYNPNVQNAEIDRVEQKFSLRVAQNEFELQYALTGNLSFTNTQSMGSQLPNQSNYLITPELRLKTPIGTEFNLKMDNRDNEFQFNPMVTFSLKQPILRGLGKAVNLTPLMDAYDTEVSNILGLRQNIIEAISKIANDYRTVIQDNNDVETARRSLEDAEKTLERNNAKIKAGIMERTANIEQYAQIERLKLSLEEALNRRDQDKQQLLQDIGLNPEIKIDLPDDVTVKDPKEPDLKQSIYIALHNNKEYLDRVISFRKATRALVVARDQQRWELNLSATATVGTASGKNKDSNFQSLINLRNHSENVTLDLSIPILDYKRRQQLVNAKVALEKQRIDLAAAKRQLITDVKNRITDIVSRIKQMKNSANSVKYARQSYELELVKQRVGRASSLDVTTAQNSLIDAQITLISNKIAYLRAVTDLDGFLGISLERWHIKLRY